MDLELVVRGREARVGLAAAGDQERLARGGAFGSVYPTYGFIYNRPDTGPVTASVSRPAPLPDINPAPSDLRPPAERSWQTYEEVAEAPARAPRRIDLRITRVASER